MFNLAKVGGVVKVASSAEGQSLDSQVSPVFGRCQCFVIVGLEDDKIKNSYCLENAAASEYSGAGTEAAQIVGDEETDVVISGSVGPKAFSALKQRNIRVYRGKPGTVRENIDKLSRGELEVVDSPTGSPHMGLD